jgi:virginiamycin B lyase
MKGLLTVLQLVRGSKSRLPKKSRPAPARATPVIEPLEDRWVPSTVTEFPSLPTANAAPAAITTAHDGSLWFTEKGANKLGRLTTAGVLTEYAVPTAASAPEMITVTPDGNVWFTERYGRKIGRIDQAGGAISEFAVPGTGAYPTAITTTPAGTVWFATDDSAATARLGWISSTGTITQLATGATRAAITGIAGGPDGNLWATEVSSYWGDAVAKVSTSGFGHFTNYRLPNRASSPQSITVGADQNLWFTEKNANQIGRMTTAGVLSEFALASGRGPQQITAGPDGALWFTEQSGNQIGRITVSGAVTEYAIPTASSQPFGITTGQDGNLYFTEGAGNKIGEVIVSSSAPAPSQNMSRTLGATVIPPVFTDVVPRIL